MKKICLFYCWNILLSTWAIPSVSASQPMEERPLKERVELASHVFVGVLEKVIVLDEQGQEIPDDKLPPITNLAFLQVRVEESLTPAGWRPSFPVIVAYGGFFFKPKDMREKGVGQRSIYLTQMDFIPGYPHFWPLFGASYGYFLNESTEKKDEILKLVKSNPQALNEWSHIEWLARSMKDVEAIRVGTTREKVGELFSEHWNPFDTNPDEKKEKYASKKCPFVKLDVEFKRLTPDSIDNQDVVIALSKPYLEWFPFGNK